MELNNLSSTNRYKLLKMLGAKCRICTVDKIKYLEIDHIYNDGADERTKYGSPEKIYGWYIHHESQAFKRLQPLCKEHHHEKHHPILNYELEIPPTNAYPIPSGTIFIDILNYLATDNRNPVPAHTLITELFNRGRFTELESNNLIKYYLGNASIYESKVGHYNTV